jgi:hypothetical protein
VHEGLLAVAVDLANPVGGRPTQASLKRAVSTAYYALFHALQHDAADLIAGADQSATIAWNVVYRALNHGDAKRACLAIQRRKLDGHLIKVATAFLLLQESRIAADYDPRAAFDHTMTMVLVELARQTISTYQHADATDRRAFVLTLLFSKGREPT